jgi:hypothetical protein
VILSLGYTVFIAWIDDADIEDEEAATAATEIR